MKKVLLTTALLCLWFCTSNVFAQTTACTVDNTISSPGIYPSSDTLPDGCVNSPYDEVVQFAFPPDTTLFGFTLPFDSFKVSSVNNIPTGLSYQCDQYMNNCTYYTTPGQLTRGCVTIYGTPLVQFNDSVEVVGRAFVTFFGSSQAIDDTIRLNIHIYNETSCPLTSLNPSFASKLDLNVSPNPIQSDSRLSFTLPEAAQVEAGIYDMYGREVVSLANSQMGAGYHQIAVQAKSESLANGIYFLKFNVNNGAYITSRKLISAN
jgi:hypothetical protein